MNTLRVVLADDHPLFLDGLRAVLADIEDITVVGEATDGRQAVALCRELRPEVAVLDLHMPSVSGIEASRAISEQSPDTAVLVLTMAHDDDSVFAALRAGARGYLLKGADADDLIRTIRAMARGEAIFGPGVATRALGMLAAPASQAARPGFPALTDREQQVVELIAQGLGNQAIAARLELSPKTVMNYVSNVFAKLHVADRAEMIVRAPDAGYGTSGT